MLDCLLMRPITSLLLAGKSGALWASTVVLLNPYSPVMTLFSENDNVLPLKIRHFLQNFQTIKYFVLRRNL